MLPQNQRIFERCNILQWQNAGYTGKGVKIGVLDLSNDLYQRQKSDSHIHHIFPDEGSAYGGHVAPCVDIIRQIAPDAEIYVLNNSSKNAKWLLDNNMDIVSVSAVGFAYDNAVAELYKQSDTVLFAASGNAAKLTEAYPASYEWAITVAAIEATTDKYYRSSSANAKMDCCGYTYVNVLTDKGAPFAFNGTSCAAPWVAGMYALVRQKVGKQNYLAAREFIRANCLDYLEPGWDERTGCGLFVLPDVSGMEENSMKIEMTIGSKIAYVDGKQTTLLRAPEEKDGTTVIPLRFVAEALGCQVAYEAKTRKITITK